MNFLTKSSSYPMCLEPLQFFWPLPGGAFIFLRGRNHQVCCKNIGILAYPLENRRNILKCVVYLYEIRQTIKGKGNI